MKMWRLTGILCLLLLAGLGLVVLLGAGAVVVWLVRDGGEASDQVEAAPSGGDAPPPRFVKLQPSDGETIVLGEEVLRLRGRLEPATAGPLRVSDGRSEQVFHLKTDGSFDVFVRLEKGARQVEVEVSAGVPPRVAAARG